MSKRMIRIKPGQIYDQLQSREGLIVNAVLKNGHTFFGRLSEVDTAFVSMKDTRDHIHKIPFSGIYEIIYDFESK